MNFLGVDIGAVSAKAVILNEGIVVLTGGVAQNRGVIKALENELKTTTSIPEKPQITGALGAALIAADDMSN